jgi:hypothetical protein
LLYFGSHKLGSNGPEDTDFGGVLDALWTLAKTLEGGSPLEMPSSAAGSALSIEVRDFEEEKSLDMRQRRLCGSSRAGRLWQDHLF